MPILELRDAELWYEEHGSGPPLMMVAGTRWRGHLLDLNSFRFHAALPGHSARSTRDWP